MIMEFFRRDSWVFSLDFGISDIQTGHTGSRTSFLFFFFNCRIGTGIGRMGLVGSGLGEESRIWLATPLRPFLCTLSQQATGQLCMHSMD